MTVSVFAGVSHVRLRGKEAESRTCNRSGVMQCGTTSKGDIGRKKCHRIRMSSEHFGEKAAQVTFKKRGAGRPATGRVKRSGLGRQLTRTGTVSSKDGRGRAESIHRPRPGRILKVRGSELRSQRRDGVRRGCWRAK